MKKRKNRKLYILIGLGSALFATVTILGLTPIFLKNSQTNNILPNPEEKENTNFEKKIQKIDNLHLKNENLEFENLKNFLGKDATNLFIFTDPKIKIHLENIEYKEKIELTKITVSFNDLNFEKIEKEFFVKMKPKYKIIYSGLNKIAVYFKENFSYKEEKIDLSLLKEKISISQKDLINNYKIENIFEEKGILLAKIQKISTSGIEKEFIFEKIQNISYISEGQKDIYINVHSKLNILKFNSENIIASDLELKKQNDILLEKMEQNFSYFIHKITKINNSILKISFIILDNSNNRFFSKSFWVKTSRSFKNREKITLRTNQNKENIELKITKNDLKLSDFLENTFSENEWKIIGFLNEKMIIINKNKTIKIIEIKYENEDKSNTNMQDFSDINSVYFKKEYLNKFSIEEVKELILNNPNKLKEILTIQNLEKKENIDFNINSIKNSENDYSLINVSFFSKLNTSQKITKDLVLYNLKRIDQFVQEKIDKIKKNLIFSNDKISKLTFEDLQSIWFKSDKAKILKDILKIKFPNYPETKFSFTDMKFLNEEKNSVTFKIKVEKQFEFDYFNEKSIDYTKEIVISKITTLNDYYENLLSEYFEKLKLNDDDVFNFKNVDFYNFNKLILLEKLNNIKSEFLFHEKIIFKIISFEKDHTQFQYKTKIEMSIGKVKKIESFNIKNIKIPQQIISNYVIDNNIRITLEFKRNFKFIGEDGYEIISSNVPENNLSLSIPSIVNGHTVLSIKDYTFYKKALKNVMIGEKIRYIGKSAFEGNEFENLTISKDIHLISEKAFFNNKIRNLIFNSDYVQLEKMCFGNNKISTIKLKGDFYTKINESYFGGNEDIFWIILVPVKKSSFKEIYYDSNNFLQRIFIENIKKFSLYWSAKLIPY